jgi:hypothetical protein
MTDDISRDNPNKLSLWFGPTLPMAALSLHYCRIVCQTDKRAEAESQIGAYGSRAVQNRTRNFPNRGRLMQMCCRRLFRVRTAFYNVWCDGSFYVCAMNNKYTSFGTQFHYSLCTQDYFPPTGLFHIYPVLNNSPARVRPIKTTNVGGFVTSFI